MRIESILKEGKGTVVDVRSPGEFFMGNVGGSINIPLQDIPQRMAEIKGLNQPLILCCASGNRSGNAQGYLAQNGIDCVNGGPWFEVEYIQNQVK